MKKNTLILLLVLLITASTTLADERNRFGIGVIAGIPSGITGKFMLDDVNGIDMGAGWRTSGDNEYYLYGDYLLHIYDVIPVTKGKMPLYFGGGLRFIGREDHDDKLGVRLPLGVEYLFDNVSLGAFFELVPVFNLSPDSDFDLEGGVGIRFFF
jgi:hypothetical protein